mmetsp:Transcript_35767/g.111637  ORF Transcript_35767/g.111637 Transcript_35767/m.111637 type:complete len:494 (+) Transcript_35767:69-1550(+)
MVPDVLILGAGIAGVKAAAWLHEAGRSVLVLEQSARIGGRMWDVDFAGAHVELGANWIEGIPQWENPIWKIGQEIGLRGNYTNQEGSRPEPALYDERGLVPRAEAQRYHDDFAQIMHAAFNVSCARHFANQSDISLRAALTQVGWPDVARQTPIQRTLEYFVIDWDFEYPAEQVSLFNYFAVGHADSWREACNGGALRPWRARTAARVGLLGNFSWESPRYFVTDPRGYAAVAEHVAQAFLAPPASSVGRTRLLFNKTVTHIFHQQSGGVRVRTSDGSEYSGRFAICTFSAGVVNEAIASRTLFYPDLPVWKRDAFAKVANGIYTKIFLKYSRRFWHEADYVLYADPRHRGYYAVWQDLESGGKFFPKGTHLLMVTVVQQDSRRVESQLKNVTVSEMQAVLKSLYGEGIPEPTDVLVPRWQSNPAFRGCWSNVAIGATKSDFEMMQRRTGGLFFAGEATDYDYNGFVAGGFNSGRQVAEQVERALVEAESVQV